MIYVIIMACLGLTVGGFITENITLGIIGIISVVILTICGITKRYLDEKKSYKYDFVSNSSSNSRVSEIDDYDKYEFENYSLFDFSYYVKKLTGDYNHPFEKSLKKVLAIERIDFKTFVLNFDFYYNDFSQFNFQDDISKKYYLAEFFGFFESYLTEIKNQGLTIEGFYTFLKREAETQEICLKNKCAIDENIVTAIYNGKRPVKYILDSSNIIKVKNLLEYFLKKEGKDLYWLSKNISSHFLTTHYDLEEKYSEFDNPSLEDVLDWFNRYCRQK